MPFLSQVFGEIAVRFQLYFTNVTKVGRGWIAVRRQTSRWKTTKLHAWILHSLRVTHATDTYSIQFDFHLVLFTDEMIIKHLLTIARYIAYVTRPLGCWSTLFRPRGQHGRGY